MNIALIGASGFIGSALREEALSRGHTVTAVVSNPGRLAAARDDMKVAKADVLDTAALSDVLRGHDAVLSAFSGHAQADVYGYYLRGIASIIAATATAGVPRLLVVGAAGSLEVGPGLRLLDTPDFPQQWKATAEGADRALELLRREVTLDWTMLSPSAQLEAGERSGNYRLGADQLLIDAEGRSRISVEDYAKAMIDELEQPAHARRRFTAGY